MIEVGLHMVLRLCVGFFSFGMNLGDMVNSRSGDEVTRGGPLEFST